MPTRISPRLASMNIKTFAKSQFGCLTLLDSRVSIESNCDVITSFVTLVCLWGLSRPQPPTHGTCTNGIGGAPTSVLTHMHFNPFIVANKLFYAHVHVHMLKGM
jgi:hypothetical protein